MKRTKASSPVKARLALHEPMYCLQYEIRVQAWIRALSTVFLMPSIRRSLRALDWDCRSAVRLSKLTEDGCGRRQMCPEAPSFSSRCQLRLTSYPRILLAGLESSSRWRFSFPQIPELL